MDRVVFFGSIFTGEAQYLTDETEDQPTFWVTFLTRMSSTHYSAATRMVWKKIRDLIMFNAAHDIT